MTLNRLCEIWNQLNDLIWPKGLGTKPKEFSNAKFRDNLTLSIEHLVAMYSVLQWNWVHNLHENEESYNDWFKAHFVICVDGQVWNLQDL